MRFPTYKHETEKQTQGFKFVAGCDEVGIGPLAGPVVAATVILDPLSIDGNRSKNKWWSRVRDSKTVNEEERMILAKFIKDHAIDFSFGIVAHETIDEINIYEASLLAMKKSVDMMKQTPDFIFVDGIHPIKNIFIPQKTIISGDAKVLSISAASIIAKVTRDEILSRLSEIYPQYGFAVHKGYGTKFHREALEKFGVSPVHRQTFGFVSECLKRMRSMGNFRKQLIFEPSRT